MGDISPNDFPPKKEKPLTRIADHDYFIIPGVTDVDKIRDQAYQKSRGDSHAAPESTMVHYHRSSEECLYGKTVPGLGAEEQRHDWFVALKLGDE